MSNRAFTLTEERPLEAEFQQRTCNLLDRVVMLPAVWFAMPIGHIQLTQAQGAKLARMGATRGLPDLMIVHDGAIYAIELKRPGGRLSRTRLVRTKRGALRELIGQEEQFERLSRAGMRIAVCHDTDEVLAALHRWRVPVRIASLERAA